MWSMKLVQCTSSETGVGVFTHADGTEEQVFLRTRPYDQERERIVLQRLQQVHLIPAPRFLGMMTQENAQQTMLIQSYVPGVDLATLLPPEGRPPARMDYPYTPIELHRLVEPLQALGRAIAHLHAIKATHFGSVSGDAAAEYHGTYFTYNTIETLLKRGRAHGWLSSEEVDHLRDWIRRHLSLFAADEQASLVHADLHPGNIRVQQGSDGAWHLQGVVDFEHAKYWYPEYDLVVLHWHLGQHTMLWDAFLHGYGPLHGARMQFFAIAKLLMIVSGHPPADRYAQWAHTTLRTLHAEAATC
jgi:aminoglycoside phosphotransferase (APT) family kinase protein